MSIFNKKGTVYFMKDADERGHDIHTQNSD